MTVWRDHDRLALRRARGQGRVVPLLRLGVRQPGRSCSAPTAASANFLRLLEKWYTTGQVAELQGLDRIAAQQPAGDRDVQVSQHAHLHGRHEKLLVRHRLPDAVAAAAGHADVPRREHADVQADSPADPVAAASHFLPATMALSATSRALPARNPQNSTHRRWSVALHQSDRVQRGFSLVETIIATGLIVAALVTLAHLLAIGVQVGRLRAHPYGVDAPGGAKDGRAAGADVGGRSRRRSASRSSISTAREVGCVADAPTPCGPAAYVCRWSAGPAAFNADVLVIEVDVAAIATRAGSVRRSSARGRERRHDVPRARVLLVELARRDGHPARRRSATVFRLINPASGMFDAELERVEMQQRVRASADAIFNEAARGGRRCDDSGGRAVPPGRAQSGCRPVRRSADRLSLFVCAPETRAVADTATVTYWLRTDPDEGPQLMRYDGRQSDVPLVDHVSSLRFDYFGGNGEAIDRERFDGWSLADWHERRSRSTPICRRYGESASRFASRPHASCWRRPFPIARWRWTSRRAI